MPLYPSSNRLQTFNVTQPIHRLPPPQPPTTATSIAITATMHISRLCVVLPTESDDTPVKHDDRRKQPDKRSRKNQGCGIHIPDFLRRALDRLHATHTCVFCRGAWRKCPSLVYHDTEGVQFPKENTIAGHGPKIFTYSELYIGTKGFSKDEILGSGGFGRVYRAVLPRDGSVVAVKCLMETGERFEKTFAAELAAVANLRHRNLVPLRGWCVHDDQLLLVYEYMPNRSLDRVLFRRASAGPGLGWDQRMKIAIGLALALFYLHEQLEAQIIHRDVKTSNVMLDSNFEPKLGDFGLAKWLEHELTYQIRPPSSRHNHRAADTTRIGGTIGYLSPENFQKGGVATAKSDVFSFGIVLLEIVTGRRAVDLSFPDEKIVLLDWIRELADEGMLLKAIDRRLTEGSYKADDINHLTRLGLLCTLHDPRSRPDMKWILKSFSGHCEDLPDLPSFKTYPRYISVSPPIGSSSVSTTTTTPSLATVTATTSTTTTTTTTTVSAGTTIFITAKGKTLYVTAEVEYAGSDADDMASSMNSTPRFKEMGYSVDDGMTSSMISTPNAKGSQPNIFPGIKTSREITYKEIVSATDNFSEANRLAELDFGTAYYGVLDNQDVIVKRLGMKTCPALRTRFSNELSNLGRLCHRNLVQLHGWCTEQGEMLVVYNYQANRVLSHLLSHHNRRSSQPVLSWYHRYNILRSLADVIHYLHEEWEQLVVHRNITSSAVGIEPDMNPRLGSFALAEFLTRNEQGHDIEVNKKSSVRGIFGYMAPEYMESGEATTMVDVYSFGVMVLEVVTGQMAVDFRRPEVLLVKRAHEFETRERDYEQLVDPRLDGEYDRRELVRLVNVAIACTRSNPDLRPGSCQVVGILDGNDKCLEEVMQIKEKTEEWKERNKLALSLVRRVQALGLQ